MRSEKKMHLSSEDVGRLYAAYMNEIGNELAIESGEEPIDDGNPSVEEVLMPKLTEIFKIREAVTPDKLHDPQDFVAKLREVAAEASSEAAAMSQFLETVDGNPEFNLGKSGPALRAALDKLTEAGKALADIVSPVEQALLQKEREEESAKNAPPSYGSGATFKKI
jgi:hypothetical protein